MTAELSLFSALLIGLAGGVHCVGMCGGVVGALSYAIPKQRNPWPFMLSYNLGRIASYTVAGAIAGGLGDSIGKHLPFGPLFLNTLSGLLLLAMALYLANWWRGLTVLEKAGGHLWQRLRPLSTRWIPFKRPLSALPYGIIWGWLPCGLVYSTLSWSMASGSWTQGAIIMCAFGLGTLPTLLVLGNAGQQLKRWLHRSWVRTLVALSLLIFALFILLKPWLSSL